MYLQQINAIIERQPQSKHLAKVIPKPQTRAAKACLLFLQQTQERINQTKKEILNKIDFLFEQANNFISSLRITCQSYLEKIQEYSSLKSFKGLKQPLINQQEYLMNVRKRQRSVRAIQTQLKELSANVPSEIKMAPLLSNKKVKAPISCVMSIFGCLYFGTREGHIVYEEGLQEREFQAHKGLIRSFAWDGQFLLASGGDDSFIKVWCLKGKHPTLLATLSTQAKSYTRHLLIEGKTLVSTRGQFDAFRIRWWSLQSYSCLGQAAIHKDYIRGLALTSHGRIVSAGQDTKILLWKATAVEEKHCHHCKVKFLFCNRGKLCIIDEEDSLTLYNEDTLRVIVVLTHNRKVHFAYAKEHIYLHLPMKIVMYGWEGAKRKVIDVSVGLTVGAMWEYKHQLIVCGEEVTLYEV